MLLLGLSQYSSKHSCAIAMKLSASLVNVHVVHPYGSADTTADWQKLRSILSDKSDFHMTDSLSIAVQAFVNRVLISFSVDEMLLPR